MTFCTDYCHPGRPECRRCIAYGVPVYRWAYVREWLNMAFAVGNADWDEEPR